jgi:hypothetical protein
VAAVIRTRILRRYFGDGFSGVVATTVVTWGLSKLREGLRHEDEVIDVSRLRVGETYSIVTRPAPTRAERKLAVKSAKASERAHKATRPTSSERRTARALERAQRKAAKARPGSPKAAKRRAEAAKLETRYAKATARTPKQLLYVERAEAAQREYEAARTESLAKARRKARPPRQRVWRNR